PRVGLAELGVPHLGRVPGKAVAQMGAKHVRRVPMAGVLGVESLREQDAPARLAAPVGERPVEVPDQKPHVTHAQPTSWKTARVTGARGAPPYTTSRVECTPDSTRVCATSSAMSRASADTTKRCWSPIR